MTRLRSDSRSNFKRRFAETLRGARSTRLRSSPSFADAGSYEQEGESVQTTQRNVAPKTLLEDKTTHLWDRRSARGENTGTPGRPHPWGGCETFARNRLVANRLFIATRLGWFCLSREFAIASRTLELPISEHAARPHRVFPFKRPCAVPPIRARNGTNKEEVISKDPSLDRNRFAVLVVFPPPTRFCGSANENPG